MEGVLSAFLVSLVHHLKTLKLFHIDILVNCSSCENCDEKKINFPEELQDPCSLEFTRNLFQSRLKLMGFWQTGNLISFSFEKKKNCTIVFRQRNFENITVAFDKVCREINKKKGLAERQGETFIDFN